MAANEGKVLAFAAEAEIAPVEAAPTETPKKKKKKAKKYVGGRYYRTSLTYVDPSTGAKKTKYFYGDNVTLADRQKKEFADELAKRGALPDNKITFGQLYDQWLAEKRDVDDRSYNLCAKYDSLRHFLAPLEGQKVKNIKHQAVQDILVSMAAANKAASTIRDVKSMIKQVLDYAETRDLVDKNVASKTKIPAAAKPKVERQPVSPDIQILVLQACQSDGDRHRMCIPALLMLFCGLRRGEMAALRWGDVTVGADGAMTVTVDKAVFFEVNKARAKNPKSHAGVRTIPVPTLIAPILMAQKATAHDDAAYIMISEGGLPVTKSSYKVGWASYMQHLNTLAGGTPAGKRLPNAPDGSRVFSAGTKIVDPYTAHQLRHSYASNIYAAGCDELVRKKWLGHERDKSDVTEGTYTHILAQLEHESMKKYDDFCNRIFAPNAPKSGRKG